MAIRLIQPRYLIWIILVIPTLSHGGLGKTKHEFYHIDKEKNCALCHIPRTGKTKPALWMSENKTEVITSFGTETQKEEILCLSCHDGVMAKDMYIVKSLDQEKTEEILSIRLEMRYYRIGLLTFNTCEKHYYLLLNYQNQFPKEKIKCSLCHDIHNLRDSSKTRLIDRNIFKEHKICQNCH